MKKSPIKISIDERNLVLTLLLTMDQTTPLTSLPVFPFPFMIMDSLGKLT